MGRLWTPRALSLTFNLILLPPRGWTQLRTSVDRHEPLPRPLLHGAAVAGVSVGARFVRAVSFPEADVADVTLSLLYSVNAYLGALVLPAWVVPRLKGSWRCSHRYASAAVLPVVASGALTAAVPPPADMFPLLAGCLLTCASSFWGARTLLDLSGLSRFHMAAVTAALACAPPLGIAWCSHL